MSVPTTSGKEKRKERLRQEILQVASELFSKEGYEQVTMRRIAERVEYTQGAIYFHFKDKADILEAICRDTFADLTTHFEEVIAAHADPLERLVACSRAFITFCRQHPHHYRVVFMGPATRDGRDTAEVIGELGAQCFDHFCMLFTDCVAAGKFRPVPDAEVAGHAWWACVVGTTKFLVVHEHADWVKQDAVMEQTLEMLVRSLAADEGTGVVSRPERPHVRRRSEPKRL